ncbi:MAG: helix-turn-helix domain-containing protein [Ktedonobacteraceae bacterium]
MNLDDYRKECGFSISELARRAEVDYNTVDRALKGKSISGRTAFALAQAISERLGRPVRYQEIDGLNVNV